jgi:hypothetical protein
MTTHRTQRRIPLLGIVLIAVGMLLLMNQFDVIELTLWNFITGFIILYGGALVVRSFGTGDRSKVFWGTALFLFGLYLILDSMGLVTHHFPILIPAIFLIVGFSFLMMYLYNISDWHLLIPSLFFIGISGVIIAEELSLFQIYRFEYYLAQYWPVLLILIGLVLIVKSRSRLQKRKKTAAEVEE